MAIPPICGCCHCAMTCKENEVLVRDQAAPDLPSTARYGDLFECRECGARVITGFGKPVDTDRRGIVWRVSK